MHLCLSLILKCTGSYIILSKRVKHVLSPSFGLFYNLVNYTCMTRVKDEWLRVCNKFCCQWNKCQVHGSLYNLWLISTKYANTFVLIDCEKNQFLKQWIMATELTVLTKCPNKRTYELGVSYPKIILPWHNNYFKIISAVSIQFVYFISSVKKISTDADKFTHVR